jgi:hypothetical protein
MTKPNSARSASSPNSKGWKGSGYGPWSGQPSTGSTACSPAQYGRSKSYGSPMFSRMPPPGARLSDRISLPFSQTAKASQSDTECMLRRMIRRPAPARSRHSGRCGREPHVLETEAHNHRVRGFYASLGFALQDSVWMSTDLSP